MTAGLAALTFGVLLYHGCMMRQQGEAARDQLSLAYPPRVIVTSLQIWEEGDKARGAPDLKPGMKIKGVANAVNIGREGTRIERSECFTRWYPVGILPMKKPHYYEGPGRNPLKGGSWRPDEDGTDMLYATEVLTEPKPGEIGQWVFNETVPQSYDPLRHRLYVIGQVIHFDRLGTRRATFFCREYDPAKQTFIPVKNTDYESEE